MAPDPHSPVASLSSPNRTQPAPRGRLAMILMGLALILSIGISAALERRADLLAARIEALEVERDVSSIRQAVLAQAVSSLAARLHQLELGDRA